MAEDLAKSNFSDLLKLLNRKFLINECKWRENKIFEIKFRTRIDIKHEDYHTYCDEWVELFSQVSNTVWVHTVSNTGPKVKFRKQYLCWTREDQKVQNELLFDPCRCKGSIDIKVLGCGPKSQKNNYAASNLNTIIKVNFHHLHPVETQVDYSFFVHHCSPQPVAPKVPVQPNKNLSHLIAKVVESGQLQSQKAAERVRQVLEKNSNTLKTSQNVEDNSAIPISISSEDHIVVVEDNQHHLSLRSITTSEEMTVTQIKNGDPIAQVIVDTTNDQAGDVFYVQQLMFDASTQTLREVISVAEDSLGSPAENQFIQVQIPTVTQVAQLQPNIHSVSQQY